MADIALIAIPAWFGLWSLYRGNLIGACICIALAAVIGVA